MFFRFAFNYLIFSLLLLAQAAAQAENPETTREDAETIPFAYLILDASSSMWGRIDGSPKIDLAKEVLSKIISSLPKKVNTGLTVYGHRKQNDCNDIEVISPLGIMDKTEVTQKLRQIIPRGKSPMTAALRHVFDLIKSYDGPKTIILVSDGVESCGQDPCALVKEMKEKKIDFKMEVIGLNVTESESKQLNCIAEASGGSYQFIKSLAQVYTPTLAPYAPIAASPVPYIRPIPTALPYVAPSPTAEGLTIINRVPTPFTPQAEKAKGSITFERENWLLAPHYWRLIDPNTGEEVMRSKSFEQDNVPEGTYILAWRQYERGSTEVIVDNGVIIKPGAVTSVSLSTAIRLNVPTWVKPPRYWGLHDPDSTEQIAAFTPFEPFLVPPGEYELVWRQYENRSETISFGRIEVLPGQMNEIEIKSSISPQIADWVNTKPYYWGLRLPDSIEYVARFYGEMKTELVPEGKYSVVYRLTANDSTDAYLGDVEVLKTGNKEFFIDSGIVFETIDPLAIPQEIQFSVLDEKDIEISTTKISRTLGPIPLKPGKYRVSYISGAPSAKQSANSDILTINQGELLKVNLDDLFHETTIESTPIIQATPAVEESAASIEEQEPETPEN